MSNFGFTLSDDLDLDDIKQESKSMMKPFQYFQYSSQKIKQKPFSTFDYSLDDSMNIVIDQVPIKDNKYDQIIDRQQKLIDLLKDENTILKDKIKQFEQNQSSNQSNFNFGYRQTFQQLLPLCYLLNVNVNSQYIIGQIYQSVENIMTQLVNSQNQIKQLEKKSKQNGMQRVNSTTYLQKPYGKQTRGKRVAIQYREKQQPSYVEKLQKQVQTLKQQCSKLRKNIQPTPFFVPSVKQKRVQVVVQKVVQKIVQKVVQKIVQVPKEIQKIVHVQKIIQKVIQKPVYFQKKVRQQVPMYIQKIVQKVQPIYIDRQIQVQKIVYLKCQKCESSQNK